MESIRVPNGVLGTHEVIKTQDIKSWHRAAQMIIQQADRSSFNLCKSDIGFGYINDVFSKGDLLVYVEVPMPSPRRQRSSMTRVGGFLVAEIRPKRDDIKILLICTNAGSDIKGVGTYLMARAILLGRQHAKFIRLNAIPSAAGFYRKQFQFISNKREINKQYRQHRPTYLEMLRQERNKMKTKAARQRPITDLEILETIHEVEGRPMILEGPRASTPRRSNRLAVRTPGRSEVLAPRRSPRLHAISDGRVVKRRSPRLKAR
jgi:hypothetical protein